MHQSSEPISTETLGAVRRIWLNRPEARNAQSQQMLEALDQAFTQAEHDPPSAWCCCCASRSFAWGWSNCCFDLRSLMWPARLEIHRVNLLDGAQRQTVQTMPTQHCWHGTK